MRLNAAQWRTVAFMSSPFLALIATATVALRPISVRLHFSSSSFRKSVISVSSASGASNTGPESRKSSSVASSSQRRENNLRPPFTASISRSFFSPHISTRRFRKIARRTGDPGLRLSFLTGLTGFTGLPTSLNLVNPVKPFPPFAGSSRFGSRFTTPSPNAPSPRKGSFGGSGTSSPSSFR